MTTIPRSRITAEEFLDMPEADGHELVDGQLVEVPMGEESNWLGGELHRRVSNWVIERGLGRAFPQDSGIQVWDDDPDRVRKPDLAFYRRGRIPATRPGGWTRVVPDLVAEIISPNDLAETLQRKVREYRDAGVELIWVIFPESRSALVYRRGHPVRELSENDALDGEDLLPGFSLTLAALFATAESEPGPTGD